MTSGSPTLTTTTTTFQIADAGKVICVVGAGAYGANLITTIASVAMDGATSATLADSAGTTVTGATVIDGTDNSGAVTAAIAAMPTPLPASISTGVLLFPQNGLYVFSNDTNFGADGGVQVELDEGAILWPLDATITINGRVRCHPNQFIFAGMQDVLGFGRYVLGPGAFDRLNVKNFGAMGDGVTDDSGAFNAAIRSVPTDDYPGNANGAVVTVPPSTYFYYLADNVRINRQIILEGAGGASGAAVGVSTLCFAAYKCLCIDSDGTSP